MEELLKDPNLWTMVVFVALFVSGVVAALRAPRSESRQTTVRTWAVVARTQGLESIERVGGRLERLTAHPNVVGLLEGQRLRATTESRDGGRYSYDVTVVELDLKPSLSPAVCAERSWARRHILAGQAPPELEDVFRLTAHADRDRERLEDPGVLEALLAISRVGPPTLEAGVLHLEVERRLTGAELDTLINHLRELVLALQAVHSGRADVWNV